MAALRGSSRWLTRIVSRVLCPRMLQPTARHCQLRLSTVCCSLTACHLQRVGSMVGFVVSAQVFLVYSLSRGCMFLRAPPPKGPSCAPWQLPAMPQQECFRVFVSPFLKPVNNREVAAALLSTFVLRCLTCALGCVCSPVSPDNFCSSLCIALTDPCTVPPSLALALVAECFLFRLSELRA